MSEENAAADAENTAQDDSKSDASTQQKIPSEDKQSESNHKRELSDEDVQAIIDRYKLKSQPTPENSELLGLVKRMDDKQRKLQSELSELRYEKKYGEFLEQEMSDKDFVTEGGRVAFDKYMAKGDRSDPKLWDDAREFLSTIVIPKASETTSDSSAKIPQNIDLSKFGKPSVSPKTGLDVDLFKRDPAKFKSEIAQRYKK